MLIRDIIKRARPLTAGFNSGAQPNLGHPSEEQNTAFLDLKKALIESPIPAFPQKGRPFMIDTDESMYAMGATLLLQQDLCDENKWENIGYWSKAFYDTDMRYSATEREFLSVVWSLRKLLPYVKETKLVVQSDYNSLRWMLNVTDPHVQLTRCRLSLVSFLLYRRVQAKDPEPSPQRTFKMHRRGPR